MAEGAGVPFAKLLVLNCGEEVLCAPRAGAGSRLATARRPLHLPRPCRAGPHDHRPQRGLDRGRRREHGRALDHRARRDAHPGADRGRLPADVRPELSRDGLLRQHAVRPRRAPRRAQRLQASLAARGRDASRGRCARLHARARPRLQPPERAGRRRDLGPRGLGRARRDHRGRRLARAHEPLHRRRAAGPRAIRRRQARGCDWSAGASWSPPGWREATIPSPSSRPSCAITPTRPARSAATPSPTTPRTARPRAA